MPPDLREIARIISASAQLICACCWAAELAMRAFGVISTPLRVDDLPVDLSIRALAT